MASVVEDQTCTRAVSEEQQSPSKRKREEERTDHQGYLVLIKDNDDKVGGGDGKMCGAQRALFIGADEFVEVLKQHTPLTIEPSRFIAMYLSLHSTRCDGEAWENYNKADTALARALLADPRRARFEAQAVTENSVPITHIVQLHTKVMKFDPDDDEDEVFSKPRGRSDDRYYIELHSADNCILVTGVLLSDAELGRILLDLATIIKKRRQRITDAQVASLQRLCGFVLRREWSISARRAAKKNFIVDDDWAPELADAIKNLDNFDDLKARVVHLPEDLPDDCYIALSLPTGSDL